MSSDYIPSAETQLLHRALIAHAQNLKTLRLNVPGLASLHEEIEIYRRLIKRSQGEGSAYYQLSVNFLTLCRMASNDENEIEDLEKWLAGFPILMELFERVMFYLDALQTHKVAKERTIQTN